MAKTDDKLAIAERIRKALQCFVYPDEKECIIVFESSAGNLHAVVGSRRFLNLSPTQRQEEVWNFLNKEMDPGDLVRLFGVHTKDPQEFAADSFRRQSSAVVELYVRGANGRTLPELGSQ